ncbi:MAG: hypothetical protein R3B09_10590 [Nannocystaceae bacterium]
MKVRELAAPGSSPRHGDATVALLVVTLAATFATFAWARSGPSLARLPAGQPRRGGAGGRVDAASWRRGAAGGAALRVAESARRRTPELDRLVRDVDAMSERLGQILDPPRGPTDASTSSPRGARQLDAVLAATRKLRALADDLRDAAR